LSEKGRAAQDTDGYARALELMAATPAVLRSLIHAGPPELLGVAPSPEGWSAAQVVNHMLRIETELINRRVELMLEQENPEFPAPTPGPDDDRPVAAKLADWERARAENLRLLGSLSSEQLARGGRHPRWGAITVREHVVEWAYHDLDHLRQLLEIFQGGLYEGIGVFKGLYPKPGAPATA
jgi:hypothetical protein